MHFSWKIEGIKNGNQKLPVIQSHRDIGYLQCFQGKQSDGNQFDLCPLIRHAEEFNIALGELPESPFLGPLFEGVVASEIVKQQIHHGKDKALYHFRDRQGLEVDFIVPRGENRLMLMEAKATRTPQGSMAKPLRQLLPAIKGHETEAFVVHQPARSDTVAPTLATGVRAVPWTKMSSDIL